MTQPPDFDPEAYYGDPSAVPPPSVPPAGGYGNPTDGYHPPYHGANPDPWAYAAPQTPWSPYATPTGNNGLAVASLVVGIVSLVLGICCCLGLLGGIAAIVMGFVARGQINASGGRQGGNGMALAGIITGGIAILIAVGVQLLGLALGSWDPGTATP